MGLTPTVEELELEVHRLEAELNRRRQQEKHLLASEELHRVTLNSISDAVFITDDQGRFTFVCPNVHVIFGYSQKDVVRMGTIFQLIGDVFYDPAALEQQGELRNIHRSVRSKQLQARELLINVKRIAIQNGTTLFCCRDISERKQVEVALQASEQRFRQLVENIDEVFWINSADKTETIYISPAYARIWGRSEESLYQNPDGWWEAIHPDDQLRVRAAVAKQIQGTYDETYRVVRPDSSIRWVRDRAFPIKNDACEAVAIVGIAGDITEQMRWRREAEDRLKQVVQADRLAALGEMVAGVAHEINNPNSFIAYNVPVLKETWDLFKPILSEWMSHHPGWQINGIGFDEYARDMAEIIEAIDSGSKRINTIVSNLKDFARVDNSARPEAVDLNRVVESTLTIVGAKVRKAAYTFNLDLAESLPAIQGHFHKLDQVLANLLVNAAYSVRHKSDGAITVSTRHLPELGAVLLEVEDNGEGIAADVLDHIFEPFFTTRRPEGGTGLGLSVSYGLVREQNGRIGVLSRPGIGSRFSVFLPLESGYTIPLQTTILCVDDEPSVLKVLQSYFIRAKDMAVDTLSDPEAVVAYLERHPEVDIVLSDINMPGIDGWELLAKIKARFPLIAVILFSGHPDMLKARPDAPFQPDHMMEKSFSAKQLFEILDNIGRMKT